MADYCQARPNVRVGSKRILPHVNYDVRSSPIKGTFIRLPVMSEKVPTRRTTSSRRTPRASKLMQAPSDRQITPSLSRPEDARTRRFCTVRKFVMRRIADSLRTGQGRRSELGMRRLFVSSGRPPTAHCRAPKHAPNSGGDAFSALAMLPRPLRGHRAMPMPLAPHP
jgi:hypothetical protein